MSNNPAPKVLAHTRLCIAWQEAGKARRNKVLFSYASRFRFSLWNLSKTRPERLEHPQNLAGYDGNVCRSKSQIRLYTINLNRGNLPELFIHPRITTACGLCYNDPLNIFQDHNNHFIFNYPKYIYWILIFSHFFNILSFYIYIAHNLNIFFFLFC